MNNIIATTTHLMSAFPIHETIKILKKEGYTGIEMWHEDFIRQEKHGISSYAKIKKAIIQTGLKGVVHAALRDQRGNKLNICSKDEALRKKSIKLNLDSINLARQLGFHLVNIHPGHTDNENDSSSDYWPLLRDAFKILVPAAEEAKIILSVEDMEKRPKEFVMHAYDLKRLFSYFSSENLGATLDVVHSFTHGEEFPLKHLEELGVHLRHLHASGFYGIRGKSHCPFRVDSKNEDYLRKLLKRIILSYDGIITIEGSLHGVLSETRDNQFNAILDNMSFLRSAVGGF